MQEPLQGFITEVLDIHGARHSRTAPASHLSGVRQRSLRWRCCRA